ncbi:MAG: enoyl-CoA hydratase/isomerase family protein [Variovorax sp.]|nr:enoyl-CoA hydratase/isomerase family protein [Variovorax sp.]
MNHPPPVRLDVERDVATITLARPQALNALDFAAIESLRHAIDRATAMPDARAIVLRGEGQSFCGGGDVAAMHAEQADLPAFIGRMIDSFNACVMALNGTQLPVIASVHGAVAGGGISLALACDLVVAARDTRFVTAYAQLGGCADGGLSFWLTRRLGAARAFELLTLHTRFSAEEACALGLVNRVVDAERADEEALAWARQFAALPRQSAAELKQLTAVQARDDLRAHLAREKAAFVRCAATEDFSRRVAAFASRGSAA